MSTPRDAERCDASVAAPPGYFFRHRCQRRGVEAFDAADRAMAGPILLCRQHARFAAGGLWIHRGKGVSSHSAAERFNAGSLIRREKNW